MSSNAEFLVLLVILAVAVIGVVYVLKRIGRED
jgi:uncharacterized membrane protein